MHTWALSGLLGGWRRPIDESKAGPIGRSILSMPVQATVAGLLVEVKLWLAVLGVLSTLGSAPKYVRLVNGLVCMLQGQLQGVTGLPSVSLIVSILFTSRFDQQMSPWLNT